MKSKVYRTALVDVSVRFMEQWETLNVDSFE